jgi:tetratricopeptide (TPR) repeat protein
MAPALSEQGHSYAPSATPPPLFSNLGNYHHKITTKSSKAQKYFDQGLRLIYAFNHDEAGRAFHEAARLDPNCAMAYWGIALALGPNYITVDAERDRTAYEAIQHAVALAPQVSENEQAYINAIAKRHVSDPNADRKALDRAYADAMREVAQRYPEDLDAATLFAESLMDLRPWNLWTLDGQPQPGHRKLSALKSVLKRNPTHPGAIHYIHAVESTPTDRALPYIIVFARGAGHLYCPSYFICRWTLSRYRGY